MFCIVSSAFIVYAKEENDCYGDQVLALSHFLNDCGIACDVDLYHINENVIDWSFWVAKNMEHYYASHHGYVIMVCSPTMISLLEERSDNARVEMVVANIDRLTFRYYLQQGVHKTFPLFINNPSTNYVPPILSGKTCYNFPYDKIPENVPAHELLNYPDFALMRNLVATLTGQHEIPAPSVGPGDH